MPLPPPRTGGHIVVAIVLLILLLIILVSGVAVWTGLRFLSRGVGIQVEKRGGGAKEVSIKTPIGSLEVRKDVDEARLGLPIYPGSTRVRGEDSATVSMNIAGEENLSVAVAKFETSDPIDQVKDYYRARLGNQVTKIIEKSSEGNFVFEIKLDHGKKLVAIKEAGAKTRIALIHVGASPAEGN
jgi:hypothetical protein